MPMGFRFALLGLISMPAAGFGQASAPTLGRPNGVYPEPFSQIRGVRELPDGRVVVADWIEEQVFLLDGRLTRATPVGRAGAGPREYRLPGALLPFAGDSTLLIDMGNGRLGVLAGGGGILRTIPADRVGLGSPGGIDDRGRIYYAIPPWAPEADPSRPDSTPVVRFDPASGRVEQVAVVKGLTPPSRAGPRRTPGFPFVAFAPHDAWRVTSDGTVVIVRAGDYRVERVSPAGSVTGPSYAYRTESVTKSDRLAFVRAFVARSPTSGRGPGGGLGHTPPPSAGEVSQMEESNEFAEMLPPFEARHVHLAADGELWVGRGRHANAPVVYDRFDPAGRRVGQVRLSADRAVAALGRAHVYVVATDADGLEHLERYPRPRS